jgi:hypothetical protein
MLCLLRLDSMVVDLQMRGWEIERRLLQINHAECVDPRIGLRGLSTNCLGEEQYSDEKHLQNQGRPRNDRAMIEQSHVERVVKMHLLPAVLVGSGVRRCHEVEKE